MHRALWLAGLLVLFGGLFGMHGLDDHAGAGMGSVAHAAMAAPAHSAPSGQEALPGTAHLHAVAGVVADAVVGEMATATRHAGMSMGATGACMAVLVLSLLLLILRLVANRMRPMSLRVARAACPPRVRGRDPDPPSLFRLSIQRC